MQSGGVHLFHLFADYGCSKALKVLLSREAASLITQRERDKIRVVAEQLAYASVDVIKIIAMYKGLEEEKRVNVGSWWSKKIKREIVDVVCPSMILKNKQGETALACAQKALESTQDRAKHVVLRECIELLDSSRLL